MLYLACVEAVTTLIKLKAGFITKSLNASVKLYEEAGRV